MLVSLEHPGNVLLVPAQSVGSGDTQSLNDKDGAKVALCNGAGQEYVAKPSWEDGQINSSPCKPVPSALSGFFSKMQTQMPKVAPSAFPQQVLKFICSVKHTHVKAWRDEWAVERKGLN